MSCLKLGTGYWYGGYGTDGVRYLGVGLACGPEAEVNAADVAGEGSGSALRLIRNIILS